MIIEVTPKELISRCISDLGFETSGGEVSNAFLAALLRRTAGVLCPCSRTTLTSAISESLAYLHSDGEELSSRIESLTDDLIVAGDLLELSNVTTGDSEVKGTWVFCSPPAFIQRRSGDIFLMGIVPDHDSLLPEDLRKRVAYRNAVRLIEAQPTEALASRLEEEGFNRLSEAVWLKSPKAETAADHLASALHKLSLEQPCGPIADLQIIDPEADPKFYRGRWSTPSSHSGTFVARRPHEFRAPTWCFVELHEGMLNRLVDLPLTTFRWRGCDAAWQLQMAIDREIGRPQQFRVHCYGDVHRFEFFSPIPLWAERRLMILGKKCAGDRCLFAYELPAGESSEEEEFLKDNLWLVREDSDERAGAI